MGIYLNPTNEGFQQALNSPIYVDKTGMIETLNKKIGTNEKMICVSRPRRFGKTMAADMLLAYYNRGCNSEKLFEGLEISRKENFREHLNKYDVIRLDMQWMLSNAMTAVRYGKETNPMLHIQRSIIKELYRKYPDAVETDDYFLPEVLQNVYAETGIKFVVIIDEWDVVFRNYKDNNSLQEEYLELLRVLFKGSISETCIALAYITGILPIKKYGTQSAMNNFMEYTMLRPGWMSEYVGFTETEVISLCKKYNIDFENVKKWYDGYYLKGIGEIYNPRSVVETMLTGDFGSHWTSTETYESLRDYIIMDMDGLKEAVKQLITGNSIPVNTRKFLNDMTSMNSSDEVLSLLIHLGYLGYDEEKESVFIPNEEVKIEFENAVEDTGWSEVVHALKSSGKLLADTLNKDSASVAEALERVHEENVSVLTYNDENALSFIVSLAYYSARKDYIQVRELPTGKGFADIVFLPRKHVSKPALLVELKWDKTVQTAISQIKEKHYVQAVEDYIGKILLVGINYDKETKKHQCVIEEYQKQN